MATLHSSRRGVVSLTNFIILPFLFSSKVFLYNHFEVSAGPSLARVSQQSRVIGRSPVVSFTLQWSSSVSRIAPLFSTFIRSL